MLYGLLIQEQSCEGIKEKAELVIRVITLYKTDGSKNGTHIITVRPLEVET